MAEIIKILRERQPPLRLIGKRYGHEHRLSGGFGHLWGEWFEKGWFRELEALGEAKDIENGYLGFMRCEPGFEYWIGMFFPWGTVVPEGFCSLDVAEGDVGVCWIQGPEDDGGLFAMHEKCVEALKEQGMAELRRDEAGRCFFFERYNCPRFTQKDQDGNVILDYGMYLK